MNPPRHRPWIVAALLAACEPAFDRFELDEDPDVRTRAEIGPDRIEVPAGTIAVGVAELHSSRAEDYLATDLEFRSQDPEVLDVARGDQLHRWVFIGRTVGETCVEVIVDDDIVDCIEAEVVAP